MVKKILFAFWVALFMPFLCAAQNFSLTLTSKSVKADSLHFQSFDKKKNFVSIISVPYSEKAVLKQKGKLEPGYYQVSADSVSLFEVIISEERKLALVVSMDEAGTVTFENSPENNNNIAYRKQMEWYRAQSDEINKTFEEAQKTMPQYMLQTLVQNLMVQADTLTAHENAYKRKVVEDNKGTLFASIVQSTIEAPAPPQEYYGNRNLVAHYFTQHAFDNFPFDDGRMANTPMLNAKMKEYCNSLYYKLEESEAAKLADELLTSAQVNSKNYHTIFDHLEKVLGTMTSPFWTEEIYIAMLRNALAYEQLDPNRVNYYKQVLELHTKNLAGTVVPNFNILLSDGTKTTLYDIDCEYMLLYFQNPDCPTCTEVRGILAQNEDLSKAINSGKLKMLTIYFEKDEDLWRRYLKDKANPMYLHGWDYQGEIEQNSLFDLRIIPYMFLLDKDKRVIRKDIYHNEISNYLKKYKIY